MINNPDLIVSADELISLVENKTGIGFWSSNLKTNELFWSSGLYRIFGVDPLQFKPSWSNYFERIHPEDRTGLPQSGRTTSEELLRYRELRVIRLDGELRWIANQGQVLFDTDGTPVHMLGVVSDITAQVHLRQNLQTQSNLIESLTYLSDAVLWDIWPTQTEIVAQRRFRTEPDTEPGRTAARVLSREAIHPDDCDRLLAFRKRALEAGQPCQTEFRADAGNGTYVRVRSIAVPNLATSGPMQEWIGATRILGPAGSDDSNSASVTAWQVRAARGCLEWSANQLAEKAGVSVSTVRRVETQGEHSVREEGLAAIKLALETAGVEFGTDDRDRPTVVMAVQ